MRSLSAGDSSLCGTPAPSRNARSAFDMPDAGTLAGAGAGFGGVAAGRAFGTKVSSGGMARAVGVGSSPPKNVDSLNSRSAGSCSCSGVLWVCVELNTCISGSFEGGGAFAAGASGSDKSSIGSGSITCTSYSATSNESPECSTRRVPGP